MDLKANGRWFAVPQGLVVALGAQDSVMLAYLCNVAGVADKDRDGWWPCSRERLARALALGANQQKRSLGRLEAQGLLERDARGPCARRHFRINEQAVQRLSGVALLCGEVA